MNEPLPERLGKYTISKILGHGAMGVVYKGFDPHIQRPVAIKTIHKDLLGDYDSVDSIAARFRNEAQAVGRIAHPGVVAIYELGLDQDVAFIAMEYVEGRNLDQLLAATPMLDEPQILSIMDQLLDALGCAHQHGVWHRDIKPANLLLTQLGQIKLTDFGIARIENAGLTQVSTLIGTPGYMSPEQYKGEGVDHRADLFASGVLLYRLLAGRAPFSGRPEQVMYQILNEDPVPPSHISSVPRSAAFDPVVKCALAKRADQRYSSALEFRQALAAAAGHPSGIDQDATVIAAKIQQVRPHPLTAVAAHVGEGGPFTSGGASGAGPTTNWDAPTLSRIERVLASYVGPMAKLMVRDAARQCPDLQSLAKSVAEHIGEDRMRIKFIHEATAGSQALPVSAMTSVPVASPVSIAEIRTDLIEEYVPDELKSRALQVLTRHVGPIARLLVKRAAERAKSRTQFVQFLLDETPDGDRERVRQEMQKG